MALTVNLHKAEQSLKLCLQKSGVLEPPKVDLAFVLDVSGSFDDEHSSGITDQLLSRLVPWGMTFDPDHKLDVFTFSSGTHSAHHVGEVNASNYERYVQHNIIRSVPGYGGGTEYAPIISTVLDHFGWRIKKQGLLSRLLGQSPPTARTQAARRSLIIFVTDGENSDQQSAQDILTQAQELGAEVYFLFIGVSNQGGQFPFLQHIAKQFDNTGLTIIRHLRTFTQQGDDQLNSTLLHAELIQWLKNKA